MDFKDRLLRRTSTIMINLNNGDNLVNVARKTNTTYVYALEKINFLEKIKVLDKKKEGRDLDLELTKKGSKIKDNLMNIEVVLGK